ncbi:tRNA uracil 4-sulfurtransferase ThiI [Oceanirhabdus sp. W0125-5]|uniref:tRNA uracil 4-sulfurtransferase ThiI n=1 Tax=Oceanirhabdus sp. W0125-5 TaxID=2999116 RepID=UPI0022F2B9C6|nr:tRNA uracil 4-sulfurtransferase ThiI [Oceanirhabdus sp. W0125-5]WBW95496.1 tRNA 4-thiouridine(8) synthase ThiI [Oceanirhabdus sp. W0125-5]
MRKLILIKYASEIFLKGLNRRMFEDKLINNIKCSLGELNFKLFNDEGRWFIDCDRVEEAIDAVKKVFGVTELCIVYEVDAEYDEIKKVAINLTSDLSGTFKVSTNRANKKFEMKSMEISREIGGDILENNDKLTVKMKNPDHMVYIEIRKKAYVYTECILAVGGLPYGINGSTMLMLSGGIDSPVAGYLMARRGVELQCVYYHSHPYTSEKAKEKVIDLAKKLKKYTGTFKLHVVSFTDIQMDIIEMCRKDELTIIMRRFMMKIACMLAEKYGIHSVTSGESVGQVASQTMESLVVTDNIADRPAFRPLIAMDKNEIMDISRKIDTYETSILPYEDCCTIFVPKHPKTKPKLKEIIKSESVLDFERLCNEAIDGMETIEI